MIILEHTTPLPQS